MSEWVYVIGDHRVTVNGFRTGRTRRVVRAHALGRVVVCADAKGRLFSDVVSGRRFYSERNIGGRSLAREVLDCAIALGALEAGAVDAVLKAAEERREIFKRYWAAKELKQAAEQFGVKLAPSVQRRVEAAIAAGKTLKS